MSNIPDLERYTPRGVRMVPQNKAVTKRATTVAPTRAAAVYFWSNPEFGCPDPHPDSDVTALAEGWITVTPLQFDLTHEAMLREMGEWQWRL